MMKVIAEVSSIISPAEAVEVVVDEVKEDQYECAICITNECDLVLECGHRYHRECIELQLSVRWPGPNISFGYMNCAQCRQRIAHPAIVGLIHDHEKVENSMREHAAEEILKEEYKEELDELDDELLNDKVRLTEHALDILAYFQCGECGDFFCGGLQSCGELMDMHMEDVAQLKCSACEFPEHASREYADFRCKQHTDYHNDGLFKCDSCCSVATWRCCNDRYCDPCHSKAGDPSKMQLCPGPIDCPLKIRHQPNFEAVHCRARPYDAFIIGCARCLEEEALGNLLEE